MNDSKLLVLDLSVTILLVVIGCAVGKYAMDNISNTWLAFNGPAVGILVGGELIWLLWIRKRIDRS